MRPHIYGYLAQLLRFDAHLDFLVRLSALFWWIRDLPAASLSSARDGVFGDRVEKFNDDTSTAWTNLKKKKTAQMASPSKNIMRGRCDHNSPTTPR
jgi:hypothetical protein